MVQFGEISFTNVSKTYLLHGVKKNIARDVTFTFPGGETIGLVGRNGAGKSSLLRLISGLETPDQGRIIRNGSISWPVGFQGSFHPDLTGLENTNFVARAYGIDRRKMADFVNEFAELGAYFRLPLRSYSAGMRARLAFAISMAVPFNTYLIDEITSVGDTAFRNRSEVVLNDRLKSAGAIIVSHSMEMLRTLCGPGLVLENGRLFFYARVERAIEHYNYLMKGQLPPWMR